MHGTDALGRATFHAISPRDDVRPTERDIRWMIHLERHGPLDSTALIDLTSDTHRCKDTALRRLQALRAGGYLSLPKQQRARERAEFRPYIYDLAPKGHRFLGEIGLAENAIRPTGHWWHIHETANLTSRIDRACRKGGLRYIPAHEILERAGASLAIPVGRRKLIPDQLFAIDYGGRFRAFMVEVDRGTEPIASGSSRKSWRSSLDLYDEVFRDGLANRHYGLNAPILVLWMHGTAQRHARFCEMVDAGAHGSARRHLSAVSSVGTAPPEPVHSDGAVFDILTA